MSVHNKRKSCCPKRPSTVIQTSDTRTSRCPHRCPLRNLSHAWLVIHHLSPRHRVLSYRTGVSSRALEEAARPGDGNRLVHHPLSHTEVLVDPAGDLLALARHALCLEPARRQLYSPFSKTAVAESCQQHSFCRFGAVVKNKGCTHVSPVERFMPARNAETM